MPLTLVRTSDPSNEPVTNAEAKTHLRVDTSDEDSLIDALIASARRHVEEFTGRSLITQTWELSLDRFPGPFWMDWHIWRWYQPVIELPRPPIQSVDSITYTDENGASQTWDSSKYQVDTKSEPARLRPSHDEEYPDVQEETLNAVTITYTAGYGANADDVPNDLRQAMLLLIGELYERREETNPQDLAVIPFGARSLMWPYRMVPV